MNYFDDVGAFHAKFDLPRTGDGSPPGLLEEDVLAFRMKFLEEELREFELACDEKDLAAAADALADLVYVALGTAHMMALPFDDVWREVQRANMTKVRAAGAGDPRSTRGHALDVVKPPGFVPPDHGPAIERARAAAVGEARPGTFVPTHVGVVAGPDGEPRFEVGGYRKTTDLEKLIVDARARYDALTSEDKLEHDRAQRRSFVRGQCPSDRDYAEWCRMVDALP